MTTSSNTRASLNAINDAINLGTDTMSEPFEGKARTHESPHIVAPPTCHVEELESCGTSGARSTSSDSTAPLSPDHPLTHTTPALVSILCRTACMAVRVSLAMSPGLSAGIAEVEAMSDLAFHKRFRSSYDSLPSSTLPVRKRYRGTSKLILGTDSEEVEESSDSHSKSEGAKDEGPIAEDEDPAMGDKGLAVRVEGLGVDDESYGLDDESHGVDDKSYGLDDESHGVDDESRGLADEGFGVETDGLGLKEEEDDEPGSAAGNSGCGDSCERAFSTWVWSIEAPRFSVRGRSCIQSILQDHTQRLDVMPPTLFAVIDRDVRELYTQSKAVREEIFSQRYQFRSLEHEKEMTAMTFGALWRPCGH
nr:hypothetical protein [Tanacetum cinerariifolium]